MKNKPMSQQENQERTNQAIEIEDLTVEESGQDEVTGGANNLTKVGVGTLILANANTYNQ